MIYTVTRDRYGRKNRYAAAPQNPPIVGGLERKYDTIDINGTLIANWTMVEADNPTDAITKALPILKPDNPDWWYDELGKIEVTTPSPSTKGLVNIMKGKI